MRLGFVRFKDCRINTNENQNFRMIGFAELIQKVSKKYNYRIVEFTELIQNTI